MFDRFNRNVNYLRISVTDRCNLRCRYCMPEAGIKLMSHKEILSYEEIVSFTAFAASYGISKVRLTGGEPLIRKGIVKLVRMISAIPGIKDLSMTTNGLLLSRYANDLALAGLNRVNISLDTLNPIHYRYITRYGDLEDVLEGIIAAKRAGLKPVKINCVVKANSKEPDALAVREFSHKHQLSVRFIRQMNLESGSFYGVEGGKGGICQLCNRLRLTADGHLKPCLFSENGYNIRELGYKQAFLNAIKNKPEKGTINQINDFYNIGG